MSAANKKEKIKQEIKEKHGCSEACSRCARVNFLIDEMFSSNIPIGYWFLNMNTFSGSKNLLDIFNEYKENLAQKYMSGSSICFAGSQGTGKTMASICVLKEAIKANYSAYYTTASDILSGIVDYRNNLELRSKLREADFLVIDELDSRFFTSDSTKELFSGIYENVFRYRTHNLLPTIICTNETTGLRNVFFGQGIQSIESLNNQYLKIYPIIGMDFRKKQNDTK